MSEMTGNTALLAQVRGWWAGGRASWTGCVRGASSGSRGAPRPPLSSIGASWGLTFKCPPSCGSCAGLTAVFTQGEVLRVTFKHAGVFVGFQVTNYSPTGIPLIQLWSVVGDEVSAGLLFPSESLAGSSVLCGAGAGIVSS